jgi:signal transduction histidine kinase
MRTPVAAIEGYLALALNDKVSKIDDKARSFLEKAHASTEHLGKLFQDLLTSAKAEDGRLTSHPTIVNISDFIVQLVEDLKFSAEKKGLALEMQSSSSPQGSQKNIAPVFYAKVDPDRLREVVTNLFDNAVKYTEVGKITIGITGNNEVIQFSIKDTGHGIPKADIPHMFQKFYRVDNSATRTIGGTGLGLFICRKIVELYNGKIWVESEEGVGSTFYINLPRIDTQQALRIQAAGPTIEPTVQKT